jgi:hypothetical protein
LRRQRETSKNLFVSESYEEKRRPRMDSIPQTVLRLVENLSDFKDWEEDVLRLSQEIAQQIASMVLRTVDDQLMKERDGGLRLIGKRERTITTRFGPLKIERRLYRKEAGDYHFLLDKALGLKPGSACTPSLEHLSILIASHVPFRTASSIISHFIADAPSHGSIHKSLGRTGREKKAQEDARRRSLLEDGELPPRGDRKVERLLLEADGLVVSLQREKKRRREMKLAFSYEGWEACGKGRFRTTNKTIHSGFSPTDEFWWDFSLSLAERYDLSAVEEFVLGGDGASWVKGGGRLIPVSAYQLDRFHLKRSLKGALKGAEAHAAYRLACDGDWKAADGILEQAENAAGDEERQKIADTRRYLASNRSGLSDWRKGRDKEVLRGMGTAEGNIDKELANRLKKRGMSWTVSGGHSMAKVIQLRDNQELEGWIFSRRARRPDVEVLKTAAREASKRLRKDPEEWLSARMPSLDGPHSDRPWAAMLRELGHLSKVV